MASNILAPLRKVTRNYHFWLMVAMFVIAAILHYPQQILSTEVPSLFSFLGLPRHSIERIFLLLPVIYTGHIFGTRAGSASMVVALAIMLPRAFLISPYLADALWEIGFVIIVGSLANWWFHMHRKDISQMQKMEENLHYYLHEITRAQEEERKRISRELHDGTTQNLIALLRQLENFINSNNKELSGKDVETLWTYYNQIKHILQELRRFTRDLRPSVLDDLGLIPALEWINARLSIECGLDVKLVVSSKERRLPREIELLLFRVVQESLRNVTKHAKTSKAEVNVDFLADRINITVSDKGRGFELPAYLGNLPGTGRLGLVGMRERIQLLGGNLNIVSELGKGTDIFIEVPI